MVRRTHAPTQAAREERTPERAATGKQTRTPSKRRRAVNLAGWRDKLYVDVPTAAAILDLGKTTVWEMVYAGSLPSRKFNTARKVPTAALIALTQEQGGGGDAAA